MEVKYFEPISPYIEGRARVEYYEPAARHANLGLCQLLLIKDGLFTATDSTLRFESIFRKEHDVFREPIDGMLYSSERREGVFRADFRFCYLELEDRSRKNAKFVKRAIVVSPIKKTL